MKFFVFTFILGFFLFPCVVNSQTVTQTQSVAFGEFAIVDNDSQHDLIVSPAGVMTPDAGFVVLFDGGNGSFDASGFPASTTLIITVSSGSLTKNGSGSGEAFSLVNPVHSPSTVVTDGSGNASFNLGLTLRTSGTGTSYSDGDNYSGDYTVSVNT